MWDGALLGVPALVEELVRRQVTVIAAFGSPATFAARAATTTIPIVFNRRRLSESGLVASIGRPGGNLTGVNFLTGELAAKRLELLREVVPGGFWVITCSVAMIDLQSSSPRLVVSQHRRSQVC